MANTISALKRMRTAQHRTEVNRTRKTRLRHQIRKMRRLLEANKPGDAVKIIPETNSMIDRAAKWGIIKKNTAARYKSRIAVRIKKLQSA